MYQINYWLLYQIKTTEQVYQIKEKEWEVGGETVHNTATAEKMAGNG